MIKYDQRTFAGVLVICRCAGTIFNRRIMIPSCFACTLLLTKKICTEYGYEMGDAFIHPFPFQFFSFLLGFVIVFRTNLTYERFWEGRTAIELMTSKWSDVALQSLVFDSPLCKTPQQDPEHVRFMRQLLSALSLLHAVALASLGDGMNELQVLQGLDPEQVRAALNQPKIGDMRVSVALQWVQVLITERMKRGGLKVDPPILSRVFQELSTGHWGYRSAHKIHCTPFPFPYAQLIASSLIILLPCAAIMMDRYVDNWLWATGFCFLSVCGFYAVNEVAIELEDPFGNDENDLPMETYQREFNERLLMLANSRTPQFCTPGFDMQCSIRGNTMSLRAPSEALRSSASIRLPTQEEPSILKWIDCPAHPKVNRATNCEDEKIADLMTQQQIDTVLQNVGHVAESSSYMTLRQAISHTKADRIANSVMKSSLKARRRSSGDARASAATLLAEPNEDPGCGLLMRRCRTLDDHQPVVEPPWFTGGEPTPSPVEPTPSPNQVGGRVPSSEAEGAGLCRTPTSLEDGQEQVRTSSLLDGVPLHCQERRTRRLGERRRLAPISVASASSPLSSPPSRLQSPLSSPPSRSSQPAALKYAVGSPVSGSQNTTASLLFSGSDTDQSVGSPGVRPKGGYPASWYAGGEQSKLLAIVKCVFLRVSGGKQEVTEQQLRQVVQEVGIEYSQNKHTKLMRRLDRGHKGTVSFDVFYTWLLHRDKKKRKKEKKHSETTTAHREENPL